MRDRSLCQQGSFAAASQQQMLKKRGQASRSINAELIMWNRRTLYPYSRRWVQRKNQMSRFFSIHVVPHALVPWSKSCRSSRLMSRYSSTTQTSNRGRIRHWTLTVIFTSDPNPNANPGRNMRSVKKKTYDTVISSAYPSWTQTTTLKNGIKEQKAWSLHQSEVKGVQCVSTWGSATLWMPNLYKHLTSRLNSSHWWMFYF